MLRVPLSEIDEDKIVIYDIETDHQYATYAKLKTIGVQYGITGKPFLVQTKGQRREFRQKLRAPDVIKVAFNNVNFDDIVLYRYGYPVHPQNRHDLFLVFKTIASSLPAFGLKFLSFYYFGDPHFPELEISNWCAEHGQPLHMAPRPLLKAYNLHDVVQTKQLLRLGWDVVIRDEHWRTYLNKLLIGEPALEMQTEGGLFLDRGGCWLRLQSLQKKVQDETKKAIALTHGEVQNPNSSKQLARYFTEFDNIELKLSDSGEFSVDKSVLVSLKDDNPLANCAFNIRKANGAIKYYESYLNALEDETYGRTSKKSWIPLQYSFSTAGTTRTTSQSLYKINFQNPDDAAKSVQLVPPGFLGWWIDSTQIENVVHIYESEDKARRLAYESDPLWNEYVWLCNLIVDGDHTKEELDDKDLFPSPQIPNWSIYKQYKTGKLGLNFGMGIDLFCELFGLKRNVGAATFADIHEACPAIKSLQDRVASDLRTKGYVEDVFGQRFTGSPSNAYKVVAYLIQGCGTGSLPRAQIRANWETLRRCDKRMPERLRRRGVKCGVMCTTTHDENGGRIDLRLGDENILQLLQRLMFNMTDKFSPLFDNIPLRAKLYLSKTTAKKAIECDINDHKKILTIINGEPCEECGGAGHYDKHDCKTCKGIGYTL